MAAGDVAFGAFNLNDKVNYIVRRTLPVNFLGPEIHRVPLAVREGSITGFRRFPERVVEIPGAVKGSSIADLELKRDALTMALLNGVQNLKLGFQDERYFIAELEAGLFDEEPMGNGSVIVWTYLAQFVVTDPFAYAVAAETTFLDAAASTNVSGDHYVKSLTPTVGGTIYTRPIIEIVIPGVGGAPFGTTQIWVVNSTVFPPQQILIEAVFTSASIILIDTQQELVTIDDVPVDFSGVFPIMDPRAGATNTIEIHSTSTSTPTFGVSIDWTKRYV